jgi:sirohydrochlorin cobaltochelatase
MDRVGTRPRLLVWAAIILGLGLVSRAGAAPDKPAIVLTAFGTSTEAFATYKHIEAQVKQKYSGYEIRWAFTSRVVRDKVAQEQGKELKDLPQTLRDLKDAGFTQVAVQSLLVAPGEEWDRMVKASREVPGLKVAVGPPLLSSRTDMIWTLKALAKSFPPDLKQNAVVLVGHGSRDAKARAAYGAFARLLRSRYPDRNVFFGLVEFEKPGQQEVLQEIKQSRATTATFVPFLLVAGDHVENDILGNGPESWKSALLKMGNYRVEGVKKGLGYQEGVVRLYLDHLDEALQTLKQ